MLGRSCAKRIENGVDPFAGIESLLARCSLRLRIWNARFPISANLTTEKDIRFERRQVLPRLWLRPDSERWGLPTITPSISARKRCAIVQPGFPERKSKRLESARRLATHIRPDFSLFGEKKLALIAINVWEMKQARCGGSNGSDRARLKEAIAKTCGQANTCCLSRSLGN